MSSQGHSKDPGKAQDKSESSKDDKRSSATSSPTKWRHAMPSSGQASPITPTHNAGSSSKSNSTGLGFPSGKTAHGWKSSLQEKLGFGKKEQISIPSTDPTPARMNPPEMARLTLEDGRGMDVVIGNGINIVGVMPPIRPLIPNGTFNNSNDCGASDNSGTENYSDHESGSSMGGGHDESGRNSNQSPSDPSAVQQTHISALPENVLENIFSFLELSDIRNVALVWQEWNRVLQDENNEVWRTQCFRRMSREVVYSELLSSCPTFKAKLRAHIHSWNPLDCSRNIYVKPNGFTIHRNPVAQSTDGARGRIGFNRGRHAWEIVWEGPLGTVAVVGVATQQAEVRAQGYIALLGKDDQSWGWNLVENLLLHNGDSQGNYPVINNAPRYQVGERIRVILDCEDNTLSFEKNFEFLGVAFRGLPNREKLYPAVSAVYGNTEISMVYLGPPLDG